MQIIALLRGVTPIGKNRIPKMSYLVEILEEVGFQNVRTYIQSGNIILDTDLTVEETRQKIHETIKDKIGAELSIVIKTKEDFANAIKENPFGDIYDYSRIHMIFTENDISKEKLKKVSEMDFGGEVFVARESCFYMYLPREAPKKN